MSKSSENAEFSRLVEKYRSNVNKRLGLLIDCTEPALVYEPIQYILKTGGKRLRAVLLLLASESVGGKKSLSLDAACAIELLHNFTLVHDDIMDNSDMRRGLPTVHKKWNIDTAILAGDQVAACAYEVMLKVKTPRHRDVFRIFTKAFVEVCEGQAYDKEFDDRRDLDIQDYLLMIAKKTASMISAATEIGGIIGSGRPREVKALREYGEYLGIAFQIQDDILDTVGKKREFGKFIGRDIIEGKRTYLLIKALARVRGADRKLIESVLLHNCRGVNNINRVKEIYQRKGILAEAHKEMERNTRRAQRSLGVLPVNKATSTLFWLSEKLLARQS